MERRRVIQISYLQQFNCNFLKKNIAIGADNQGKHYAIGDAYKKLSIFETDWSTSPIK